MPVWTDVPLAYAGEAELIDRFPVLAAGLVHKASNHLTRRRSGFATLVHIILEQQVSIVAAKAMLLRLAATIDPIRPASFLDLDDTTLRRCGFTRQKAGYARALATGLLEGRIDPDAWHRLSDADALAAITAMKGFGPWSAQCYLIWAMGREDVFPAGDLALQIGWQELAGLPHRPDAQAIDAIAQGFRPYRTTASLLIWHAYLQRRLKPVTAVGATRPISKA